MIFYRHLARPSIAFVSITLITLNYWPQILLGAPSDSPLELPSNVEIEAEVLSLTALNSYLFSINEFVDELEGSVHVRIVPKEQGSDGAISYYRIKASLDTDEGYLRSDRVMSYSQSSHQCQSASTRIWLLKDYSELLKHLFDSSEFETVDLEKDRLSIGILGLLKLVYKNAHLFKFSMLAFDEVRFSDMYYFGAKIPMNNKRTLKVVCAQSKSSVSLENKDKSQINLVAGQTLLSELIEANSIHAYPSTLAMFVFENEYELFKESPSDLYESNNGEEKKVTISLYQVQDRSSSKHLSTIIASSVLGGQHFNKFEQNPFLLPQASGCGAASSYNKFLVPAKRFSGLFQAKGFNRAKQFIAYDSDTDHLRLDLLGEYKTIFDLKDKRVTYVAERAIQMSEEDRLRDHDNSFNFDHYDHVHCAQGRLKKSEDDGLFDVTVLESVLGFDKHTALYYLGEKMLEDGTYNLMFEREVTVKQVPLISRLTMQRAPKKESRLYLLYSFAKELALLSLDSKNETRGSNNMFSEQSYRSLWLKRVELISATASGSRSLHSQVTFSEFAWTLESMAEEALRREVKALHPVRLFDLIECKPGRLKARLDLVIQKSDPNAALVSASQPVEAESLDEALMGAISERTRISRSLINDLELVEPSTGDEKNLLVRAKIIEPMHLIVERQLVGWIESIDDFPFEKYGRFIKSEPGMNRHECSLALATQLDNEKLMYTIYCPNVGCAYTQDLKPINYVRKPSAPSNSSWSPTFSNDFYSCEIYAQTRSIDATVVSGKYSKNEVIKALNETEIFVDLYGASSDSGNKFHGLIVNTLLTEDGADLESSQGLGSRLLQSGLCFSRLNQLPASVGQLVDHQLAPLGEVKLIELKLGLHHTLADCYSACQLYHDCQTYSYSKLSRNCILANIPQSYLDTNLLDNNSNKDEDRLFDMTNFLIKADCHIYAINFVHKYELDSYILQSSLSSFNQNPNRQFYYSIVSLNECANLCHANELKSNDNLPCQMFFYFHLKSICIIEDKDFKLIASRKSNGGWPLGNKSEINYNDGDEGKDFTKLIVDRSEWFTWRQANKYTRNYEDYYVKEAYTSSLIDGPSTGSANLIESDDEMITTTTVASQEEEIPYNSNKEEVARNNLLKLFGYELYGLEREECLRECTFVDHECVMLNYCFHLRMGRMAKYCALFKVRSPLLINAGQSKLEKSSNDSEMFAELALTDLESKLYIEGQTNIHMKTIQDHGCTHYYLEEDTLIIKRQLIEARASQLSASGWKEEENEVRQLAEVDKAKSMASGYLDQVSRYAKQQLGFISIICLLIAGVTLGFVLAFSGPKMLTKPEEALGRLASSSMRLARDRLRCLAGDGKRNERSNSRVEFNVELNEVELNDIMI